ncbi:MULTISPECIES: hypothetical protein [Streptomyces]|uniref:Uncharacterized protein n=1 Tax=Streptomyces mirabilis TaxID=68239 RepID=A0ABU3UHD5_9ACTN|nr:MULTISPECIES: hypothetical protein [Streptomyces]MCX4612971.1 hypothetical protein [Streptomyces mirabilis]MCX5353102.1 hypothetical protein [Streptomyces mirabilis]MDU8993325.1 hypothetical protein [Streptomyces mirabilis]QDN81386.1 hypothetical protein FNV64_42705 [Streptomyces sp. S1A1-7]QDN91144.1 hypothetical protein FNV61_41340 [Streptomyces sp. RLB3-6]
MRQLTDLIVAAGVSQEEAKKALRSPNYKDIVREAGALTPMGADQAEVIWSGCSSLAHGDTYGTLSFLDRSIVATEGRVHLTQLTGSPALLYRVTDRAPSRCCSTPSPSSRNAPPATTDPRLVQCRDVGGRRHRTSRASHVQTAL